MSSDEAFKAELVKRRLLIDLCERDKRARQDCLTAAAASPAVWCNNWVYTFDPKDPKRPFKPFVLFPQQVEYLRWLEERLDAKETGIVEKSRDVGITWCSVVYAVHHWLFRPGFVASFGATTEDLVDQLGDVGTILEKARYLLRRLPSWMLPTGFSVDRHAMHKRIINPANGSVISGQVGDNMGRGGRSTIYFVDEAAHIPRAEQVDAATAANADCRIWVSSVKGMGNLFARKRHSGEFKVFIFKLEDDPRKTPEWIEKKQREVEPWVWASEYNRDYGASLEGLICLKSWIDAAVELGKLFAWPRSTSAVAGLDVGGGKAKSVLVVRDGPLVLMPEDWSDPDSIDLANRALAAARTAGAARLNFDAIGVGQGPLAVFRRRPEDDPMRVSAINVGLPASKTVVMKDGRTADQWFKNLKAFGWWALRQRLRNSYELLQHLKGQPGGAEHPLSDCLILPDHMKLRTEINIPRWFTTVENRIIVESKDQLAKRQIPSPDYAEALVLTLITPPVETWTSDMIVAGDAPRFAESW